MTRRVVVQITERAKGGEERKGLKRPEKVVIHGERHAIFSVIMVLNNQVVSPLSCQMATQKRMPDCCMREIISQEIHVKHSREGVMTGILKYLCSSIRFTSLEDLG